jgi:uncharacterized repeat protein (TIGR02059 family)
MRNEFNAKVLGGNATRASRRDRFTEQDDVSVGVSIFGQPDAVSERLPVNQQQQKLTELLVQFRPGFVGELQASTLAGAGLAKSRLLRSDQNGDLVLVSLPTGGQLLDSVMSSLNNNKNVKFAEPNFFVSAQGSNDLSYTGGNLWGMYGDQTSPTNAFGSQAGEAWAAGRTGSMKTVIGVVDTGIDYRHPDLYLNIWLNKGEVPTNLGLVDTDQDGLITFRDLNQSLNSTAVSDLNGNGYIDAGDLLRDLRWANGLDNDSNGRTDDLIGWDFVNNDNDPLDGNGHGTHVAGTIGAMGNNGVGVVGVNWNVQLMALKFLPDSGSGALSDAISAIDYYTAAAAKYDMGPGNYIATNNSWGGGGYSQALLDTIVRGAKQDVLFVAAAGNGGRDGIGDNNDRTGSYPSNYSTLSAAGWEAVVAVASMTSTGALSGFSNFGRASVDLGAPGSSILSTTPNGSYSSYSGTSMATPHVAGALGLLAAASETLTGEELRNYLLRNVTVTSSLANLISTGGRLNVLDMLVSASVVADTSGPTFTRATTSTDGLKVILTYNEPLFATTAGNTAFAVKVAGSATTVNSVAVNNSTVELTLATSIGAGQAVTVGYTAPAASAATTNAAVQDAVGNDAATLAATTTVTNISTVDKTAPIISTFSPTDGLTGVMLGTNIVLTFSEVIARGTGIITLRSGSATGTVVESFDAVTSSRLNLSGSTLTIDPTNDLLSNTQYFVVFTSGNINDIAGNGYAGISTYDFRTVNIVNGTADNDTLTGTVGTDIINGLAGDDIITGGAGTDSMDGGDGSDLYLVSATSDHGGAEFADTGASGTDEVRFASTTANATLTLYAGDTGIEKVTIGTGTAAAPVTTATTALNINASALSYGITLAGNNGANALTGGSGNDTLTGGAGNDVLDGGSGFDYADYTASTAAITVNLSLSTAQVTGGAGSDRLSNIEGLIGGSGADKLTGNAADNILMGGGGNDTIIGGDGFDQLRGGAGNDTLTGGTGIDWFIFDTTPNATTNKDAITDFTSGTDKLQFSKAIFAGLSGAALGDLSSNAFWSGAGVTTAQDADDRFIYDTTTGSLYYDANGNASGSAAVLIATLGATTPLNFTDLQIIG